MPLRVHTATVRYAGYGRLNITRQPGDAGGLPFAPSQTILKPVLRARRHGTALDALEAWRAYVPAYLAEMRASYRAHRAAWDALLARDLVVLVCYCGSAERCHRTILGREILPKLGAVYCGEL